MHREIRNHIEDVLTGAESAVGRQHLSECEDCRAKVRGMREHASLLRELRPPEGPAGMDMEPRAGFYARVMERIEAEGPISIWNLFIESAFGRRIAVASMALALLLGVYLVSAERSAELSLDEPVTASEQTRPAGSLVVADEAAAGWVIAEEDAPGRVITLMSQSADEQSTDDAVLANLVTYQEQ
jgi:hypothetical protein